MGERNEGKERIKCSSTTVQHIPVLMPLLMEELYRGTAEWIPYPPTSHGLSFGRTIHPHVMSITLYFPKPNIDRRG